MEGELGFRYDGTDLVPSYQFFVNDYAGPLTFAFAATEDTVYQPTIALATVGLHGSWIGINVGRIGIPLGLTPPVYASRPEPASLPSVTGAFSRAAMAVFGIPDVGASLSLYKGSFEARFSFYTPQPATINETINIIEQFGLDPENNAQVQANLVTPGICSSCILISSLTGIGDPANGFTPFIISVWQDVFTDLGINDPANHEIDISTEDSVQAYGIYYDGLRSRISLDHVRLTLLGNKAEYTVLGLEYAFGRWVFGLQGVETGSTTGGIGYSVISWRNFELFGRVGTYSGSFEAVESAYGGILRLGRYSFKLEHEYLEATIDENIFSTSNIIFSTSIRF